MAMSVAITKYFNLWIQVNKTRGLNIVYIYFIVINAKEYKKSGFRLRKKYKIGLKT